MALAGAWALKWLFAITKVLAVFSPTARMRAIQADSSASRSRSRLNR